MFIIIIITIQELKKEKKRTMGPAGLKRGLNQCLRSPDNLTKERSQVIDLHAHLHGNIAIKGRVFK